MKAAGVLTSSCSLSLDLLQSGRCLAVWARLLTSPITANQNRSCREKLTDCLHQDYKAEEPTRTGVSRSSDGLPANLSAGEESGETTRQTPRGCQTPRALILFSSISLSTCPSDSYQNNKRSRGILIGQKRYKAAVVNGPAVSESENSLYFQRKY